MIPGSSSDTINIIRNVFDTFHGTDVVDIVTKIATLNKSHEERSRCIVLCHASFNLLQPSGRNVDSA